MTIPGLGFGGANRKPLGIQLYSVREQMSRSVPDTLRQLAQIGYREVEFAGYFNLDAPALRRLLTEYGLAAPASHVSYSVMRTNPEDTIEFATALGHRYIVVPSLPKAQRQTLEMDIFWVVKAGHSPVDYINTWQGRFPLWHLKDISADGSIVDVGAGEVDFPALFELRKKAGLLHGFVEHDRPADAFRSARNSFQYLADRW
jgi:sugar phosphate isomerase/epimerase